ncbi:MAG: hypothetical protein HY540_02990 [Deltaproteobacteria bacterium]|nr:hypothetical protein [Deltaproteobacteria bacterium]
MIPRKHLLAGLLSAASAGFLLCGYEFLRSTSYTLFKGAYGVDNLPFVIALLPIGAFLILYLYGQLLSLFGPRRTLLLTTLGSSLVMIACYLAIQAGSSVATAVLFVFREVYIVLLIEQYWSFINSTLGTESAKRLYGPICGIAAIGATAGGFLLHRFAVPFGTEMMILFAAAFALPAILLAELAYAKCGEPQPTLEEARRRHGKLGLEQFRNPLLICLFVIIVATQVISVVLELKFQSLLQLAIPNPDQQTAYSGRFFGLMEGSSLILQFLVAPLLFRFVPMRAIQGTIPLIHLGVLAYLIAEPTLFVASSAYLLFKTVDYSIFRASKEMFYIPLPFDARYRAKEVIDIFGYRSSKGVTSFLFFVLQKAGIAMASFYSFIAMGAAAVWFLLVFPLTRNRIKD